MKLAMYPVTNHEKIGVRWGLEGIEPEYILKNLGQKHPEEMVFTILINMSYPHNIIANGRYLNPRILKMLDECFYQLNLCLVHLGDYPETGTKTHSGLIMPTVSCEWFHEYGSYVLVDNQCSWHGEVRFWEVGDYFGNFYGDTSAAIFIMSSKESIFRLQDLLKQHCKQEHIEFTEYPNAKYVTPPPSVDKKVSTFFSKLFK